MPHRHPARNAGFNLRDGDPGLPDNAPVGTLPASSTELNPIEGLDVPLEPMNMAL